MQNFSKYRDQARALAIRAAREKAVALSGELGQKVGRPYSIREEYSGWGAWYNSWWGSQYGGYGGNANAQVMASAGPAASGAGESTLAPGQISVNARVTVSFELQ